MLIPANISRTASTSLCNFRLNEQSKRRVWTCVDEHILTRSRVKILSLLRVSTNFIQALITKNFDAVCLDAEEGGRKHELCKYELNQKNVFLIKSPYSRLCFIS